MQAISVAEAAERLGVRRERVRQLIDAGQIDAHRLGRAWAVDAASVDEYAASPRRAGRPFAPGRAWALLALAGGREPSWTSPRERDELAGILHHRGLADLVSQLRGRAQRHEWYVHPSLLDRLLAENGVVRGGSAATEVLRDSGPAEIYVSTTTHAALRRSYAPDLDAEEPNVLVREVEGPWPFQPGEQIVWAQVAAVDLADRAHDSRARAVADQIFADG